MPYCCITKALIESMTQQDTLKHVVHYYDEEIEGFMLEHRGMTRGTWYFRYRPPQQQWRYHRIGSLKSTSLTEARTRCCALREQVQNGMDILAEAHCVLQGMTLENFAHAHYLPYARARKRSWDLDQRILRLHILPHLGLCLMSSIRRVDIIAWQGDIRAKGLAPSSCNRVFVLLKTIFNCAVQWGALEMGKDPCRGVHLFAVKTKKERYLTADEARRLLAALETCRGRSSAKAIQLLLFTGARKHEILEARWENVDMNTRLLTVPLSKSGKTRHIPLSDDAVRILQSIPQGESPWVFARPDGKGHLTSVFALWQRLRTTLGLHDVRLHDLRHSFASFLVNAGCSLYEVQRCLGHSDPKVTMRYAHLTQNALVAAANAVGHAVKSEASKK